MDSSDIESKADRSYMLVVTSSTGPSARDAVDEFIDQHDLVEVKLGGYSDEIADEIEGDIRRKSDPVLVIRKFEWLDEDVQESMAQYLKGVAESNPDLPIIVFDDEGGNLSMANPDLRGRVYSL